LLSVTNVVLVDQRMPAEDNRQHPGEIWRREMLGEHSGLLARHPLSQSNHGILSNLDAWAVAFCVPLSIGMASRHSLRPSGDEL
jgi:hypothetical protein